MIQTRLEAIKQKLLALKTRDKNLWLLGANDDPTRGLYGHHYELLPVLDEAAISAKEQRAGVKLPGEYREFLKTIGNGKAGPSWGLYPLEEGMGTDEYLDGNPGFFGTPFPYSTAQAREMFEKMRKDPKYFPIPTMPTTSYVWLSNHGHDMFYILVVGGEQHGTVWFNQEGATCFPLFNFETGKQFTFFDWYENWLDQSLSQGAIQDNPDVPFEKAEEIHAINYQRLGLTQIPENVFACVNLKKLLLSDNQLTSIPETLCSLEKLEVLNAFFNQIKKLPENLGQLAKLQEVYLKTNLIEALPESIGQCKKIRILDLGFNRLSELPESIGDLENLEHLSLDTNQLQKLPDSMKKLRKLKVLVLTGNPLSPEEKEKITSMLPHAQVNF